MSIQGILLFAGAAPGTSDDIDGADVLIYGAALLLTGKITR
jgi:hypothetical protein